MMNDPRPKVLILGGTGQARELAGRAVEAFGDTVELISSQAGVTRTPRPVAGRLVSGGFGGISGLQDFIETENIRLVVDATHVFATTMSDNAYVACLAGGVPRLTLVRRGWDIPPHARLREVASLEEAAAVLAETATRVLVTTGRRGLEALSGLSSVWLLVRMIEPPNVPLPLLHHQVLTARPPFTLDDERQLIVRHRLDGLLSKHSGGEGTYAKIQAAVEAELPIILIRRPEPVPGERVFEVADALQWIKSHL